LDLMRDARRDTTCWYGSSELELESAGAWRIGPYRLWAWRSEHEWRIATRRESDSMTDVCRVEVPSPDREPPAEAVLHRFGFSSAPAAIALRPLLADRAVVVSAESPLLLPSAEEITLYISTPAWMQVMIGDSDTVLEEPLHRPTDTWFGPSTMRGELCYAVRTSARLRLESLPVRPHRVVSAVHIVNGGETHLSFHRVKIPMPQMSVYGTPAGQLWTETVTLERYQDQGEATVRLGSGPPSQAVDATRIQGPRSVAERGLLTSAFSSLVPWG
jgi:hypothetical protein